MGSFAPSSLRTPAHALPPDTPLSLRRGTSRMSIAFSVFFACLVGQYDHFHFADEEVEAHEVSMGYSPSGGAVLERGNTCTLCMPPTSSPYRTAGHTRVSLHAAHQDFSLHVVEDLLLCACKGAWHRGTTSAMHRCWKRAEDAFPSQSFHAVGLGRGFKGQCSGLA